MSHGHNVNYKYMTTHNRGIFPLQTNPGDNDDSTLTQYGNKSISGFSHGFSLYSYWVCGKEGHLLQYCSKTIGRDRYEPDSSSLYSHMTHVAPHDDLHLCNG